MRTLFRWGAQRRQGQRRRLKPQRRLASSFLLGACSLSITTLGFMMAVTMRQSALQDAIGLPPKDSLAMQFTGCETARDYLMRAASLESGYYPEQCRQQFHGLEHVESLRTSKRTVCWPQEASSPSSMLACSFQNDARHGGSDYPEAYCAGSGLGLDLHKLQEFFDSQPGPEALRAGAPGLLIGNCAAHQPGNATEASRMVNSRDPAYDVLRKLGIVGTAGGMWKETSIGRGGQSWLYTSLANMSAQASTPQIRCLAWVEHPLYFMGDRYDSRNPWHALEDITHAFETYAVLAWKHDAQVVVLDATDSASAWEGFVYEPLWRGAFSSEHPPITLRELVNTAVWSLRGRKLPPGAAICFKEAAWSVHGGVSLLSRGNAQADPSLPVHCTNSTTVSAMVAFVLDRMGLAEVLPTSRGVLGSRHSRLSRRAGKDVAKPRLKVVWALRSSRAPHQQELVELLQKKQGELGIQVEAVNFASFSMEQQLRLVRRTDVLIGYHGAALTLSLFMPGESALIEIEEEYRCQCYTNAARWRNRPYFLFKDGFTFEAKPFPAVVMAGVAAAVEIVARRIAATNAGVPLSEAPTRFETYEDLLPEGMQGLNRPFSRP